MAIVSNNGNWDETGMRGANHFQVQTVRGDLFGMRHVCPSEIAPAFWLVEGLSARLHVKHHARLTNQKSLFQEFFLFNCFSSLKSLFPIRELERENAENEILWD